MPAIENMTTTAEAAIIGVRANFGDGTLAVMTILLCRAHIQIGVGGMLDLDQGQ
jgi:hypothetical protein